MTFSLLKIIDLFQLKTKKTKQNKEKEEGNPTTNARNFQFLVCLNDSFFLSILFPKRNTKNEMEIYNCSVNGKCNNGNFQFQENAIVQWVLELQGEALDMYGI